MPLPTIKRKKFEKNVKEYMEGQWVKRWSGIENVAEARQNLKITANAHDKRDFETFSGLLLEKIKGTKNHYSIRINRQWRIFFVWENNEAWEIEINKHDYKEVKR